MTGSTARAVSDSPVGLRPCSCVQAEKARAEAVAVIPLRNDLLVRGVYMEIS
jgi:hypothetical protein